MDLLYGPPLTGACIREAPLNIRCQVCGKPDSHCFSLVPVPQDHIQWIRENTVYDGRRVEECETPEDRRSMGHLYIAGPNRRWNKANYDDDGVEFSTAPPERYLNWLRHFRRSKPVFPTTPTEKL